MTESTPARTTPDNPAHGCMIDGQPAMPILISEYNALVARAARADARLDRIQTLADEHPAGIDTALIHEALDGPTSVALEEGTRNETVDGVAASTPGSWLLADSRDLSIPQQLPKFTVVHVTPEMERAATERARQMAEAHEEAEGSLVLAFGGQAGDHPSRRAGLRDLLAAAIWERQNPGRRYADCESPWHADAEEDANTVLALLYEEWPWLRAEAEDTAPNAVDALYEEWVKAGPPPLGVLFARWWDRRLVELNNARNAAKEN